MRRLKKIILWLSGFLVFFTLFGFFILPPVLKSILVKKLSENLHRQVTIQKIKINPYALTVDVKGFLVKERGSTENFASLDEIFVNLSSLSLAKRAVILEEARIIKPYCKVVRNKDESYNFSDLLEKPKAEPEKKTEPVRFSLNNITISGGSINFIDGPKDTTHTVRNLTITIPLLSDRKDDIDIFVQPKLAALINGKNFFFQGKTKPFADSLQTNLDITIKNLDLAHYLPYFPMKLNFKLISGSLDVNAKLLFIRYKDKGPALDISGTIALRNISLDDLENNPLVRLSSARVDLGSLKPFSKNFHIAQVILQSPELSVRRGKTGEINLQTLIGQEAQLENPKEATTVSTRTKDSALPLVVIDQFQIQQGKLFFHDDLPAEPVNLNVRDLTIQGDSLSTAKGSKGMLSLSLAVEKQGSLSLKGPVSIDPLNAELAVDTKDIALDTFQPYFTDKVKINITNGNLSTTGNLGVIDSEEAGLKLNYTGDVLVANFSSVDKEKGNDFLKWKSLSFDSIDGRYNPLYVHIKGISLADFYSRIAINSDGTLNLQKIFEAEETTTNTSPPPVKEEKASPTESKGAENISIEKITLQGGRIDFSDDTIKPRYSTRLKNIGGRVSTLSLQKNQPADVELRGKLGSGVPLEIVGKINPSSDNFFVDLSAKFRDLDLSPMTPYSGKHVGYTIEKGKLSLDVKYLIVKKKLDSQNKIFFDQLTLGDKVESKDAVKLPVKLAISLLKDRHGKIDLDIPVSGNLDDPQFSVWKIIVKILKNLIAKAATAPFALLGSMFGGGEGLSYVEFDYGSARVTDDNLKKIDTLVKALSDKPSLKLEITGHLDKEKDYEGLKNYILTQQVKTQKLKAMVKKGSPEIPADEVTIEPQEYEKYLTMAYKAAKFPKPRNIVGLLKTLPVPEMEKLMLTNIKITDDDLRSLTHQRALNVKELIMQSGQVNADRLFIIEPKSLTPEKKENLKNSRVDFSLK